MGRRPFATLLVAITSALAGLMTAQCERAPVVSLAPPIDLCCWCLATHSTPRGARCTRGSITDCIQDWERFDTSGGTLPSETNIRCIRSICGRECGPIVQLLPKEEVTKDCCDCLSSSRQDGVACYQGTSEECVTEI